MRKMDILKNLISLRNKSEGELYDILNTTIDEINAVPEKYDRCLRCGHKLTTEESQRRGYGEECWKKVCKEKIKKHKLL